MAISRQRIVTILGLYTLAAVGACQFLSTKDARQAAPGTAAPSAVRTAAGGAAAAAIETQFQKDIAPVLKKYCFECHNSTAKVADLTLDKYTTSDSVIEHRDKWELISQYVRTQQMPPETHKQPTEAERSTLSKWVNARLYSYYSANPDPGKVFVRRLNKSEYNNTIRDLIGVEFQPADDFPLDDSGYGFDNVGDVLTLPPILMEKYLSAADKILDEALSTEAPPSQVIRIPTSKAEIGFNAKGDRGDGWARLISLEEDDYATEQRLPAGDYIVRFRAFSEPTGGGLAGQGSDAPLAYEGQVPPMNFGVFVNGCFVKDLAIDAREDAPKVYETRLGLPGGKVRISGSVRRNRGGNENETFILNGRLGLQQPGVVFVKYMEIEGPLPVAVKRIPAKKLETTSEGRFNPLGSWEMRKAGETGITYNMSKPGEIILRTQVSAKQAGKDKDWVRMELRANGNPVKTFDVLAPAAAEPLQGQRLFDINLLKARPYIYETHVSLPAGPQKLTVAFINPLADPAATNPNLRQRELAVDYVEVVNPNETLPPAPMPDAFTKFFENVPTGDKRLWARTVLTNFMNRAYRRPARTDEVDRLMKLYDLAINNGESSQTGLKLAFKAVLVSPHFLFLGDIHAVSAKPATSHLIDEYHLASRLSYYLWSSTPDQELLDLAGKGELRKQLEPQVRRMLASPKSASFVSNFAGQWLQLRNLANMAPDKLMFADFDDGLRKDMSRETELLFENIMHQNRSVMEFLTADYSFLNARLARFYGIKGVDGAEFVKVSLADSNRRGILTQGSFLVLTSNPTRTSPVKRGKFVLENLLGTPPPPPPPDVPKLEDQKTVTGSLRQQMEVHRENPVCASCHAQMDPIGFALENFDAVGKWRDFDGAEPVEAGGNLKTGETFSDAGQLANLIASKKQDDFLRCLTEKMLTYALGRGVEPFDRPTVEDIVTHMQANGSRFDTLVLGIVKSLPFQNERGDTQ